MRRDPATGEVVLSRRPSSWVDFFAMLETLEVPKDFMAERARAAAPADLMSPGRRPQYRQFHRLAHKRCASVICRGQVSHACSTQPISQITLKNWLGMPIRQRRVRRIAR